MINVPTASSHSAAHRTQALCDQSGPAPLLAAEPMGNLGDFGAAAPLERRLNLPADLPLADTTAMRSGMQLGHPRGDAVGQLRNHIGA